VGDAKQARTGERSLVRSGATLALTDWARIPETESRTTLVHDGCPQREREDPAGLRVFKKRTQSITAFVFGNELAKDQGKESPARGNRQWSAGTTAKEQLVNLRQHNR
jgi:hypothetical protein